MHKDELEPCNCLTCLARDRTSVMATPEPGGVVDKHVCLDPQHPDCVVVLRSAWQMLGDSFVKERDDAATLRRELAEAKTTHEQSLERMKAWVTDLVIQRDTANDRAQAAERELGGVG